jgi:hypothetical protein
MDKTIASAAEKVETGHAARRGSAVSRHAISARAVGKISRGKSTDEWSRGGQRAKLRADREKRLRPDRAELHTVFRRAGAPWRQWPQATQRD